MDHESRVPIYEVVFVIFILSRLLIYVHDSSLSDTAVASMDDISLSDPSLGWNLGLSDSIS